MNLLSPFAWRHGAQITSSSSLSPCASKATLSPYVVSPPREWRRVVGRYCYKCWPSRTDQNVDSAEQFFVAETHSLRLILATIRLAFRNERWREFLETSGIAGPMDQRHEQLKGGPFAGTSLSRDLDVRLEMAKSQEIAALKT